ncbi:MAG: ribonuclease P protein component [Candidatus Rokubacteria bacterium]|nr:ribonuclease P protein component [Candidatus Rokubacteria bacterium]
MPGRSGAQGFPRSERLRGQDEFQAVFKVGRRIERPALLVLWRGWDGPRQIGFAVTRQVRGAVRRNRVRRRLREAYRVSRQGLPAGLQIVCVGRKAAFDGAFQALRQDMEEALTVVARQHRESKSL